MMKVKGGSFFSRLADAWFHADDGNRLLIEHTWESVLGIYQDQAAHLLGWESGVPQLPHPPRDQLLVISIDRGSSSLAVFLDRAGSLFAGFVPYTHEGEACEAAHNFVSRYSDIPPEVVYPNVTSFKTSTRHAK